MVKDVQKRILQDFPGMTVACYQLRPESQGSIHIQSPDPSAQPAINFNFLDAEIDREAMIGGVNWVRRIVEAGAMDDLREDEIMPGPDIQGDDNILSWIHATAETAYHPIGTCKMGIDPLAVVDPQLKVIGLEGLRVADASIMPTMVSGNTNAASMMIGEKAAEMILAA
jgi:choline dehydrogenase